MEDPSTIRRAVADMIELLMNGIRGRYNERVQLLATL